MATQASPIVSVEEYLRSAYEPDCDYVDGVVEERHLGEIDHSEVQAAVLSFFRAKAGEWGLRALTECRTQVAPNRFRVPDVTVLHSGEIAEKIIYEAPLLCVEVLSPEDTWKRLKIKVEDYRKFGVENIWIFDPEEREVFRYDAKGFQKIDDPELTISGTVVRVPVAEIFAGL
jgi:Uma2 family endonuclease